MDLFFEPTSGNPFSIEVGYFDTISEIKEKIQKNKDIPISRQTLVFNGQILQDELDIHFSDIVDGSHIQLIISKDPKKGPISVKKEPMFHQPKKIQLLVKMPTSKLGVALEMDVHEPIRRLKERIHDMENIPVGRLLVHSNGGELHDYQSLYECELVDHSEIEVSLRPSPCPSPSPTSGAMGIGFATGKKMRVMVLMKCGTKKIPVDVNPSDNVSELRKELQKLNQNFLLQLPQEGYFFIYKQNVMDDDRSFRWHHVAEGDTIEIFNGSVTGGS